MGTLQEGPTVQDVSNYHCRKQTQMLFRKVSDKLKWNLHDIELLMDVGCGSGERSTKYITFLYPRATEIIAIDPRKELIAEAKKFNQYPKVDYVVADISDWDSLEMWKGKVSHMVSLRYLNFVLDQRIAFDNMFHLLKTDGEVVLLFPTGAEVYQYIQNVTQKPKWRPYFIDTILVPEAIERRWDREMYELLLEEVGFTVIEVSDVTSESFVYPSEELFKEYS
ncbi:methyltransf_25 domain-containing protein [Trichonephila inaurata madagascariensis]|uniref:Methyltransf_25 domain-containing protein n=1 Tax=Trichonephila inaurata madagascariensis TaxID=2747483 RepID=A0A8X6MHJ4_9ARAC|nr:methyltransf_25 domain-containing protein [Trichonephila inaurata madagascariensis]